MTTPKAETASGPTTPPLAPERRPQTIRLGDLGIAPENLRFNEPPDDDLPTLAATLRAAGQLQPVTVRPGRGRKEQPFMALDGRRRRLALGLLLEGGEIDADYPVTAFVETDPARQAAAVVLTNTAVPVHVADVIAAIGRMLKRRLGVADIARALGYAEVEVKRLAALSALPDTALQALRIGRMTLRQARLLARLPDRQVQADLAEAALDGQGFQEWRVTEALDEGRATARDPRCGLVRPERYVEAGGRIETDLFGERAPVLLDPSVLTELWRTRAVRIGAAFEAEGLTVWITPGETPDLPEDLEPLGYVHGGGLPAEALARYREARETFDGARATTAEAIGAEADEAAIDERIDAQIRARLVMDQAGWPGRLVTVVVLRPDARHGVEVQCLAPVEPEVELESKAEAAASAMTAPPSYCPPQVETPEPDIEGVNHVLHALRTDVATRGLIRALADDPGVALTALLARLFAQIALAAPRPRSESALAVTASPFAPTTGRVIEALDGEVHRRLQDRRAAWETSGQTLIGWVHGLDPDERMGLLAELTALSLDLREERTTLIRRSARAEAVELAALCKADIGRHWTPDAAFLQAHGKPLLLGMLEAMGQADLRAGLMKKADLAALVEAVAAERGWAPTSLSWTGAPECDAVGPEGAVEAGEAAVPPDPTQDAPDNGAGAFEVTPEGEAALDRAA